MDQGVICSLKAQYLKNVVRKIIRSVEKKKTFPKISFLLGMHMLVAAWDAVTTKTVVNCFRKPEISRESQKAARVEEDHSFKELEEEILSSVQPDLVSENMDAVSFTDFAPKVLTVPLLHSDAEIVAELLEMEGVSNDNDDAIETVDEPVYCPDRNELLQVIETMQKILFLFRRWCN